MELYLNQFVTIRKRLESLLSVAKLLSVTKRASPSTEFRSALKNRLMSRINTASASSECYKAEQRKKETSGFAALWQQLIGDKSKHILIAVAMSLILVLGASFVGISSNLTNPFSPPSVLASNCTLTILNGNVLIRNNQSAVWENGANGMTLAAGSQVKTASESQALLTFFEGSTIRLDANTELGIEQVNRVDDQYTAIVLKQYLGQTWSIVVKLTDPRSRYEIHTPSAVAMVRGTQFVTTVNDDGHTQVQVNEGVVAVEGEGKEVSVPAGYNVQVETGETPSQPTSNDIQINGDNQKQAGAGENNGKGDSPGKDNQQANADNKGQEQSNKENDNQGKGQVNSKSNDNGNGKVRAMARAMAAMPGATATAMPGATVAAMPVRAIAAAMPVRATVAAMPVTIVAAMPEGNGNGNGGEGNSNGNGGGNSGGNAGGNSGGNAGGNSGGNGGGNSGGNAGDNSGGNAGGNSGGNGGEGNSDGNGGEGNGNGHNK